MDIMTMYFVVEKIDGDYAYLRRTDEEMEEPKLVARALLPDDIMEGSRLKYEMLQYEIIRSGKRKKGTQQRVYGEGMIN